MFPSRVFALAAPIAQVFGRSNRCHFTDDVQQLEFQWDDVHPRRLVRALAQRALIFVCRTSAHHGLLTVCRDLGFNKLSAADLLELRDLSTLTYLFVAFCALSVRYCL